MGIIVIIFLLQKKKRDNERNGEAELLNTSSPDNLREKNR
jgi:hypothetical protein